MKQIHPLLIIVFGLLLFVACHHHHDDEPAIFERSLDVPATKGSQTYTVSDLKRSIDSISSTDTTWLTVTKKPYGSVSPKVELSYEEITGIKRSAVVIFRDNESNQVNLTVNQAGKTDSPPEQENGIEDPHDTVTDQPAYSRQQ